MNKRSIVYVNFAQYDNTGRILDFLLENFAIVIQFSYDHLRLKNGRKTNFLRIYHQGKLIQQKKIRSLRTPSFLLFISLPLVAILMFTQTVYYIYQLRKRYGKFDIYFTVNAFSAWIGIIARQLRLVNKTVFWVWDYFPIRYPDWRMTLARWFYWQFDRPCMWYSDRIVFTNEKLFLLRQQTGHIKKATKPIIVPIGTNPKKIAIKQKKEHKIGFLGMIKTTQGIDMLIDSMPEILKEFPKLQLEIIGSGPEESRIKKKARKNKNNILFHGFIESQNDIEKIVKKWSIGIALYIPDQSNESYWGDPSKIKVYISNGLPVITTNVSHFTQELTKSGAGIVINYGNTKEFTKAIATIIKKYETHQKNALKLAEKYDYKKVYPKLFEV